MDEEIIKKAEAEAKKKINRIITEDKLGYEYYLYQEMKRILKEQGIDWEPKSTASSAENYKK